MFHKTEDVECLLHRLPKMAVVSVKVSHTAARKASANEAALELPQLSTWDSEHNTRCLPLTFHLH